MYYHDVVVSGKPFLTIYFSQDAQSSSFHWQPSFFSHFAVSPFIRNQSFPLSCIHCPNLFTQLQSHPSSLYHSVQRSEQISLFIKTHQSTTEIVLVQPSTSAQPAPKLTPAKPGSRQRSGSHLLLRSKLKRSSEGQVIFLLVPNDSRVHATRPSSFPSSSTFFPPLLHSLESDHISNPARPGHNGYSGIGGKGREVFERIFRSAWYMYVMYGG